MKAHRLLVAVVLAALLPACHRGETRPKPLPPGADPFFIHRVEYPGETLGEIARWHTGKFQNWRQLAKPVNPDLTRCCSALKVGREVKIPTELVVQRDPMPKPDLVTRPARPLVNSNAEDGADDEAPPSGLALREAPDPTPAPQEDQPAPAVPVAEAPTPVPTPVIPAGRSSGRARVKGKDWRVADAFAYADGNKIVVALSNTRFDRGRLVRDGAVDRGEITRHRKQPGVSLLMLRIEPDGGLNCFEATNDGRGGSSCGTTVSEGWKLAGQSDEAISGRFAFDDASDSIDVTFDVPIVGTAGGHR